MGSRPSRPDTSAQQESLRLQQEKLAKEEAQLKEQQQDLAKENTKKFNTRRRRQQGRASLLKTSERGVIN